MTGKVYNSGDYTSENNDWYWKLGLHDAEILSHKIYEYDYSDYSYKNNGKTLVLTMDTSNAMYDNLKEIRLNNFTIAEGELNSDRTYYWLEDKLTKTENQKYCLTITVYDNNDHKEKVIKILFKSAEVIK